MSQWDIFYSELQVSVEQRWVRNTLYEWVEEALLRPVRKVFWPRGRCLFQIHHFFDFRMLANGFPSPVGRVRLCKGWEAGFPWATEGAARPSKRVPVNLYKTETLFPRYCSYQVLSAPEAKMTDLSHKRGRLRWEPGWFSPHKIYEAATKQCRGAENGWREMHLA